jgi:hypothetical protein
MGAWGTAIFSDDLAADVRDDFRVLIGDGLSAADATAQLQSEYASELTDPDEAPVFWLALASAQWKLGRLEPETLARALQVIEDGSDLARWEEPKDRKRRAAELEKTRAQLLSPAPPAKRVPRTIREANDWDVGEMIGFRLLSGNWTLLRVIGHYTDKGGRYAVCELLDWQGTEFPAPETADRLPIRVEPVAGGLKQFLFQQPRGKADPSRVRRLGCSTSPAQVVGGFGVFVWPFIDEQFARHFQLS